LIASKTGYTDLAGGNLAVAFDAGVNRPIVIAVLGSSREERFSDVEKLASAVLLELTPPISKQ
jgi:D-alanyl-D-alanine carboxypeptidase